MARTYSNNNASPSESGIYVQYEQESEANRSNDPYDDDSDNDEGSERLLAKELEDFQKLGLTTERCLDNFDCPTTNIIEGGGCYGEEAMQRYPYFFRLIPQVPHYRGLLQETVGEEIRRGIYLSLWYSLVDLTEAALMTDCSTDCAVIDEMILHGRSLGRLGFDVRHVIARLKQPMYKIYDLEVAKRGVAAAKKRKCEAEQKQMEVAALERRVEDMRRELRDALSELGMKKEEVGSEDKQVVQMKRLREDVNEAEINLKAVEIEVGLLGYAES